MKFKYKLSTAMLVIFIVMYALAALCFTWNLIRLFQSVSSQIVIEAYTYISILLCLVLPIVISIFLTSVLLASYYKIDEKRLVVKFGFLADKYDIQDIDNVVKNVKIKALAINFKDESSLKILIDEKDFDDFCSTLLKANKNVKYGESDEDEKKGKNA
ncbi:MAG: PH domain-containing protein [Clostridia bacterium]|nr:PH domain-containing protein [Clostridia bacterium]